MKEFFKQWKKEILVITSVLVILLVYNIVEETRRYISNKEYCESERRYTQDRRFVGVPEEEQPDFSYEVKLKYNDGFLYYIAVINNDSWLPDPDNPNRNKQCDDITDSYFYYQNGRRFRLKVELLDKDKFLLKTFTASNFKLEDGYKSYPENKYSFDIPRKVLLSRGSMEMSKETFESISCSRRKCKDCEYKWESTQMNFKVLSGY